MWGPDEQELFERDGHVPLKSAVDSSRAERMSRAIWNYVEHRSEVRESDRSTWPEPEDWFGMSFKKLKRHRSFEGVLDSPRTRAALDGIFGEGRWQASKGGAQILFTFPNAAPGQWRTPSKLWHMDASFLRRVHPPRAVKLFTVVEPLPPRGGATLVLAGSPNLQAEYARQVPDDKRKGNGQMWRRFMCRGGDEWLARFADENDHAPDRNDVLAEAREVDGHRIELRELGGQPGDVHVTHINCFHSASSNANDRPRMLITHLVSEVAADPEPT